MVIKNLTGKLQYLWIQNLLGGRSVSVQVLPHGRRELAHTYIPDRSRMPDFDKIFEIEGLKKPITEEAVQEPAIEDEIPESAEQEVKAQEETQETETPEEEETAPETNESTFVFAECGAEFGSARGLASHQTRAHT